MASQAGMGPGSVECTSPGRNGVRRILRIDGRFLGGLVIVDAGWGGGASSGPAAVPTGEIWAAAAEEGVRFGETADACAFCALRSIRVAVSRAVDVPGNSEHVLSPF